MVEPVCFWISYAKAVRIVTNKSTSDMGPKFTKMSYVVSVPKNHANGVPKIAISIENKNTSR